MRLSMSFFHRLSWLVHSFLWWAGRDLNPRPSPCEGDVRSVPSSCLPGWTTGPTSRHWEATIFHLSRKTFELLFLAEKPNIRALRILFDESKQRNAPSPCFLYFHKRSRGELERCNCEFLFRDS